MARLSALVVATVLAASGTTAPSAPENAGPATLRFMSESSILVETAYGIDAIDDQARWFEQRIKSEVMAGQHTVWFSCPGAPTMQGGSRITHTFEAGQHYELVCGDGVEPTIRKSDDC